MAFQASHSQWNSKHSSGSGSCEAGAQNFHGYFRGPKIPIPCLAPLPHLEAECSVHRDAWVLPGVELAAAPLSLTPQGARDKGSPGGALLCYLGPGLLEGSLIWTPPGASLVSRMNEVSWSDGAGGTHPFSALLPITWEHALELCVLLSCMCSELCFVLFTFFFFYLLESLQLTAYTFSFFYLFFLQATIKLPKIEVLRSQT